MAQSRSKALAHHKTAAARQFLVEGFAWTPEQDVWFALGFPHMVLFDDAAKGDADKLIAQYTWKPFMSREVVQGMACALASDDCISSVQKLFEQRVSAARMPRAQLFCFEALNGPIAVVKAALAGMKTWSEQDWLKQDRPRFGQMLDLGMVLWRLPKKEHDKARKRLDKMRPPSAVEPVTLHVSPSAHQGLALAFEGAEAAKLLTKHGRAALGVMHMSHAFGDPAWVHKGLSKVLAAHCEPDARRVFIGGHKMLDLELKWWRGYQNPAALGTVVQTYRFIQSPKTVKLMRAIYKKGKQKRALERWFAERGVKP